MQFDFNITTKVHVTTLEDTQEYLKQNMKDKNLLIILSQSMEERFQLRELLSILYKNNSVVRIDVVKANPNENDVKTALSTQVNDFDTIIALGGGSAIDLAKAMIALHYLNKEHLNTEDIIRAIKSKDYINYQKHVQFIAIPTSAGTGSEVTSWSTIWKSDNTEKMSVDAPWLAPGYAFIIPELTSTMPKRLTLSTGLDALTHATESYWSRKSSEISRELSKIAIRHIVEYLPKVLNEPNNLDYRKKMCIGSLFAGLAFANTRTTACHSISYPLTMLYGIEHGFAVAITLVEVMKFNQHNIIELNELLRAFGVSSIIDIQLLLDNLCDGVQPLRLKELGINKAEIDKIVGMSFTAGRMDNNPVDIYKNDVRTILEDCY
jgi:alcohol dehydrogenase class IV